METNERRIEEKSGMIKVNRRATFARTVRNGEIAMSVHPDAGETHDGRSGSSSIVGIDAFMAGPIQVVKRHALSTVHLPEGRA